MINKFITSIINSRFYNLFIFLLVCSFLITKTYLYDFNYTDIIFSIFSFLSLINIFYAKDSSPFLTLAIFSLLHPFKQNLNYNDVPIMVIVFIIIYFLSFIVFLIKNKINIWQGKLRYGLLIYVILLTLISLRLPDEYPAYLLLIVLIPILYLILYLFISSSIKGDKRRYIGELFMLAGLFLSIHAVNYLVNTDLQIVVDNIKRGISRAYSFPQVNITAIILNITILTTISIIVLKPKNIIYQLSLIPQCFAMVITASRAGILLCGFFLIISVFILYHKRPSNFYFFSRFIFVLIILFVVLVPTGLFKNILDHLIESFKVKDPTTGRIDLIKEALEHFKTNPLIGKGILGLIEIRTKVIDGNTITLYSFYSFHNFVVQVLAMSGILGLICVIYHYFEIFRLLFKKVDSHRLCIILVIVCSTIHGLVDNVFFMIHYTVMSFILFGMLEAYDKSKLNKQKLINKQ